MAKKYLDDTGLSYFWGKIKSALSSKADSSDLNDYLPLTGGTLTGWLLVDDNITATGSLTGNSVEATTDLIGEGLKLQLDTTATSGIDKEIYDALVSLGWTSGSDSVIV